MKLRSAAWALLASAAPLFAQISTPPGAGVWPGAGNGTIPSAGRQPIAGSTWIGYGYGGYGGVGFGYYPGAFPGAASWSNGYSLYGPPVPTYGIVPGSFGGSNQRMNNTPGYSSSITYIPRYPQYYWQAPSVSTPSYPGRPQSAPSAPAIPVAPAEPFPAPTNGEKTAIPTTTATIVVELPDYAANAEVYFNDTKMNYTGSRIFRTPSLTLGEPGQYDIKAVWKYNGQEVSAFRSITIKAGEVAYADFRKSTDGPMLPK